MADKIRVFETFAGIGAQHRALKRAKIPFEIVASSEWYIDAIIAYYKIHDNSKLSADSINEITTYLKKFNFSSNSKDPLKNLNQLDEKQKRIVYTSIKNFNNFGSIADIKAKDLPEHDLLTYSFPCQDISIAGKRSGFKKGSGTRSSLVWHVERILKELKIKNKLPKYLLMENVVSIMNKNNIGKLIQLEKDLSSIGYYNYRLILNSYNFGVPQNRNRFFLISSLKKIDQNILTDIKNFKIPLKFKLKSIISNEMPAKKIEEKFLKAYLKTLKVRPLNYNQIIKRVGAYPKHGQSDVLIGENSDFVPTITFSNETSRQKILMKNIDGSPIVRRLTGKENLMLMGFTKKDYELIKEEITSEQKISGLAGNSIVVDVLVEIFKKIFQGDNNG